MMSNQQIDVHRMIMSRMVYAENVLKEICKLEPDDWDWDTFLDVQNKAQKTLDIAQKKHDEHLKQYPD